MKHITVLLATALMLFTHFASSTEFRTTANGPWASAGWQILTDTGWVPSPGVPTVGLLHVYNNVTIDGDYQITGDPVLDIVGNLSIPAYHLEILGTTCLSGTIGGGGSLSNAGDLNILGGGINMTGDFANYGTIYVSYVGGVGSLIGNFVNHGRIVVGPTNTCGGSLQKAASIIPKTSSAGQSVTVYLYGTIYNDNDGTIEVEPDCFLSIYSSGTMDGTIRNNSSIQFNGALDMHSTTFESNVNYCRALGPLAIFGTVTIPGVFLLEGTKLGPGTLRTDQLSWSAPVNGGTLEINGSCDFGSAVSINSATVINNGRASFTGGALNGNGTFINNDTLVIYHDGNHLIEFSPNMENRGWISKVTASMLFHGQFNNDTNAVFRNESGSVEISGGTSKGEIHIESGQLVATTYDLEPGASITGDGALILGGGIFTVNTDISVAMLTMSNPVDTYLAGSGTKTVRTLLDASYYRFINDVGGPLVVDSTASASFGGTNKGTIINYGTFTSFTAGPGAAPYGPSLFKNYGVCYLPQTGAVTCAQNVENYGRIIRTGLTEYRFLDGPFPMTFMNSGTLEVLSGDLRIGVTGLTSSPQVVPIALGGSIHVSPGARFLSSYEVSFNGDTLDNGGVVGCNPFSFVRSAPAQILTGGGTISSTRLNGGNVQMLGSQISGSLVLTSGTILLHDHNLDLGSSSVTGAGPASYFVTDGTGRLIRNAGTSFVNFPVGTAISYNPVSVKTQTGTESFSVGVSEGIVPSVASPSVGVLRTWNVSEGTPGGNGQITFTTQWNSGEQGSAFNRDSARAWRYSSGQWAAQSGALTSITPGTTYPAIATIQTSSLSPWTLANAQAPSLIAPLALAFDSVAVGLPRKDTVLVRNNGWTMLNIDSVKSDNVQFVVTPASAIASPFDSVAFQVKFVPSAVGNQTGIIVFYSDMPTSPETVLVSGTGIIVPVNVALASGWNLISNPVTRDPGTDSVQHLYPSASFGYAFAFQTGVGYQQQFTMANGNGYWEKFAGQDTNHITGFPRSLDSISVSSGWNLVGSISYPVDTALVSSDPPGIRASLWYGYAGAYAASSSLLPGQGYWIKASSAGKFILNASVDLPSRPVNRERNGKLASVDEFVVVETGGAERSLYVESVATTAGAMSELPPQGPEGTFDVRFASQKSIESTTSSGGQTIVIRSSSYPVTFKWNLKAADGGYVITDDVNGTLMAPNHISRKGELVITDPAITRLVLMKEQRVPHEFVLDQNYPNPFNPTTQIKFSVALAGRATVEMFNVLGQKIQTLFNENAEPGRYYTLNVNGTNMASGVYFYRLQSAARLDTRKMMLLK